MTTVLTKGKYLTPVRFEKEFVFGAIYTEGLKLCLDSQRYHSRYTFYQHGDSAVVPHEIICALNDLEYIPGDVLFLGHAFSVYGHFILETLPMIYYLMSDAFIGYKFLFIPWGGGTQDLLFQALDLIGFSPKSNVIVYDKSTAATGSFFIVPRPIEINHKILDLEPYRLVVDKLRGCYKVSAIRDNIDGFEKLFFQIDAKRVSVEYAKMVEGLFLLLGFRIIRPENHTLAEQIALCSKAKYIAGFSGSALHNAIFAEPGTKVIECGDSRSPLSPIKNQLIVNEISGVEHEFITYQENNFETRLRNIVSS